MLFSMIISFLAAGLDNLLGTVFENEGYGLFITLYNLAVLIPSLAVAVRRLHDTGKSGWWFFIVAVPWIGVIWCLLLLAIDSQPGENEYGLNPKETV